MCVLVCDLDWYECVATTGMVPYTSISPEEGFGSAFSYLGMDWAMHLVMAGQIAVVLPTVIMVAYFPQSRLMYAMATDGLLPPRFGQVCMHVLVCMYVCMFVCMAGETTSHTSCA
jgi:amino acid transporter